MPLRNKQSVTPWFEPAQGQHPVRPGVYERKVPPMPTKYQYSNTHYAYWDGHYWSQMRESPEKALLRQAYRSKNQLLPWRGLLQNLPREGRA